MTSTKPRKQRFRLYNAPLHVKRKMIAAHLAENLLLKYDRRSLPVIKGDTVKVMRGSYRGHENKIGKVNVKDQTVEIEGVTLTTAKGTKLARPIHASSLLITKLNLTDKWRRQKLEKGLSDTAKKEIEREAEEQIKEREEEKKAAEEAQRAEELAKKEEAAAAAEEPTPSKEATPLTPSEEKHEAPKSPEPIKKKPAAKKPAEPAEKKKTQEGEA
ncbi:MAG: 50S ribosomal protein L24 [Candidatus Thermoplasmatota archaeon]|nr:50S ribosomal protein L24 [Candidatus Thermoplasmatota archaeon]